MTDVQQKPVVIMTARDVKRKKIASLPQLLSFPHEDADDDVWDEYITSDDGLAGLMKAMAIHRVPQTEPLRKMKKFSNSV
jgi:hypothetical protein